MSEVNSIQIAPSKGKREAVESVLAIAAHGIEGDYHSGNEDAQQVTLITTEAIESFNQETLNAFKGSDLGRNIVTSGVDLALLIGKKFQIGQGPFQKSQDRVNSSLTAGTNPHRSY